MEIPPAAARRRAPPVLPGDPAMARLLIALLNTLTTLMLVALWGLT